MKKRWMIAAAVWCMVLSMHLTAFAGQWVEDSVGWWWQDDDGSWPANEWRWLDGNRDGVAECYFFGGDGYLLTATRTPDGYTVDQNGAWVENGVVCTQAAAAVPSGGGNTAFQARPAMPDYRAAVTEANILAVLDNLQPDGACIIRDSIAAFGPEPTLSWWNGGSGRVTSMLSTAVHEESHRVAFSGGYGQDKLYMGGGQYINVPYTQVFDSREIISTIPQSLRTFRYDLYLGDQAGVSMATRQLGPYGMLNEFTAYCWGTQNVLNTYEYRTANGDCSMSNDWTAYAEFRYYILRYMLYARDHHPDVYQGILGNAAFRQAFTTIESRYSQIVQEVHRTVNPSLLNFAQGEYDVLMKEMQKPEYQEMMALLRP